jgi:hypothetical protein
MAITLDGSNGATFDGSGTTTLINDRTEDALVIKGTGAATSYGLSIGASGATDPLEITRRHSNGDQVQMVIDYAGRVTMPYQPAFLAYSGTYTSSGNYEFTSYTVSAYSRFNQGNAFNATTGRFTAPVAGVYQLNFVFHDKSGATSRKIGRVLLNGVSTIGDGELAENYNQYGDVGGSVCVYLAQNDYVQWATHPLSFSGVTASAHLVG